MAEPTPAKYEFDFRVLATYAIVIWLLLSGGTFSPTPHPNPTPVVVPTPNPAPVNEGKRIVVVLLESQAQSPGFSRLRIGLQAGEARAYIKQKGHDVYFLDEQQKDAQGVILPVVSYLKSNAGGKKLPAVFICESIDGKLGKVIHVESITDEMTADNVVEYIRRGGG